MALLGIQLSLQMIRVNLYMNFLTVYFEAVQHIYRLFSFTGPAELYEGITLGFEGDVVTRYFNSLDGAVVLKVVTNIRLCYMLHFLVIEKAFDKDSAIFFLPRWLWKTRL